MSSCFKIEMKSTMFKILAKYLYDVIDSIVTETVSHNSF